MRMRPEVGNVSGPDSGRWRLVPATGMLMRERRPAHEVYRAYDELTGEDGHPDETPPPPSPEFRSGSPVLRVAGVVIVAGVLGAIGLLLVFDGPRSRVAVHPTLTNGRHVLRPASRSRSSHLRHRRRAEAAGNIGSEERPSRPASSARPMTPVPDPVVRVESPGEANPGSHSSASSECGANHEFGFESCR